MPLDPALHPPHSAVSSTTSERRINFNTMEDCELIRRYRLNREGIQLVVELVNNTLKKCNFAMLTI